MAQTQAGEFTQVFIGDETNTLNEISTYVTSYNVPKNNMDVDSTTFAQGGNTVTETHIKGAVQAPVTIELEFDPVVLAILLRVLGARGGSTVQFLNGNNAAPGPGDPIYQGTFTLFGIGITYHWGADAKLQLDFAPTEGGAIFPGWDVI